MSGFFFSKNYAGHSSYHFAEFYDHRSNRLGKIASQRRHWNGPIRASLTRLNEKFK